MQKIILAIVVLMFAIPDGYAHSGRTDKNGGHNCSEKSKKKGLCTGYHYHKDSVQQDTLESNKDFVVSSQKDSEIEEHSHEDEGSEK